MGKSDADDPGSGSVYGHGVDKLREMSDEESCDYILWVGTRRMFKRRKLEEFLEGTYSV